MSVGDAQTAFDALSAVINGIEKVMAWRAEKKRQREARIMHQNRFLHQFTFAGAPDENAAEDLTIRSYCQRLRELIKSHWSFIFGKGAKRAEAAHAFMAATLFTVAAWPGLPAAPLAPAPSPSPLHGSQISIPDSDDRYRDQYLSTGGLKALRYF